MYFHGEGVVKDMARAVQLLTKGCDMKNARGCTILGVIFATGKGVAADEAKAKLLLEQGCQLGDTEACGAL